MIWQPGTFTHPWIGNPGPKGKREYTAVHETGSNRMGSLARSVIHMYSREVHKTVVNHCLQCTVLTLCCLTITRILSANEGNSFLQ